MVQYSKNSGIIQGIKTPPSDFNNGNPTQAVSTPEKNSIGVDKSLWAKASNQDVATANAFPANSGKPGVDKSMWNVIPNYEV